MPPANLVKKVRLESPEVSRLRINYGVALNRIHAKDVELKNVIEERDRVLVQMEKMKIALDAALKENAELKHALLQNNKIGMEQEKALIFNLKVAEDAAEFAADDLAEKKRELANTKRSQTQLRASVQNLRKERQGKLLISKMPVNALWNIRNNLGLTNNTCLKLSIALCDAFGAKVMPKPTWIKKFFAQKDAELDITTRDDPIPMASVTNLKQFIEKHLTMVFEKDQFVQKVGPPGNLSVMWIGDKGCGTSKMLLVPLYWKKGGARTVLPVTIFDGDDSYENIKECCGETIKQFNELEELSIVLESGETMTFPLTKYVGGDTKFLRTVYGLSGGNISDYCLFCYERKECCQTTSDSGKKNTHRFRTLESLHIDFLNKRNGVVNNPLFTIPLSHAIMGSPFIFLGLGEDGFENVSMLAQQLDGACGGARKSGMEFISTLDHVENKPHHSTKPFENLHKEFNKWESEKFFAIRHRSETFKKIIRLQWCRIQTAFDCQTIHL